MDDLTPIPEWNQGGSSGSRDPADPFASGDVTAVARRVRGDDPPPPLLPAASEPLDRGAVVGGRYRILRQVGHGAMSRVYLAEQQGIGRLVALKVMSRRIAADRASAVRFEREARLLARVDHPNVVTVHDIGTTASGEQFMVMEYVGGRTLGQLIHKHRRLDPTRTISLLLQISRAIAAMHEVGIIHRDLKPDNVLIVRTRSGVEVAKVADFGLAKAVVRRRDDDDCVTPLTRDGVVVGTPEFMAPEQVKGGDIDPRADIYSMGCIAYEMLTGKPPFRGEQELQTLYSHLHEPPRPLADVCPEAEIPPSFQQFIDRVLAKDPEKRYPNVLHLYSALLRVSDRAGIPRRDLRLVQSLFDDPAYAKSHDTAAAPDPVPLAEARPRAERVLLCCVVAAILLVIGVALGRFVG